LLLEQGNKDFIKGKRKGTNKLMLLDHGVEISLRRKGPPKKKLCSLTEGRQNNKERKTLCYGVQQGVTRKKEKSVLGTLWTLEAERR
jgi:hypothetical protein